MKQALILLIAFCTGISAYAQSVDAALDGIIKDAKSNFEQLKGLDKSDKAIKMSNDAQIFSTQAANKAEKEVKDATGPLQMDANRADQMRSQLLAMGCPEGGGVVSIELAQRCNPLIAQHKEFSARVLRKAGELKTKMKMVNTLRANVAKTTLQNVEKQKKNDEARAKLMSQKLEIRMRAVMAGLRDKVAAEKACKSIPTDEGQVCCHKAVFDGLDLKSCGLDIMCKVFEGSGMFGTNSVVCQVTASK